MTNQLIKWLKKWFDFEKLNFHLNDIACTLNYLQIELNWNTSIGIWIEQLDSKKNLLFIEND